MKQLRLHIFILIISVLLTGCFALPGVPDVFYPTAPTLPPTTAPTEATSIPTEVTTAPTEATTVPPTEPEHSALYIPDLNVEDVISYFSEVCLDAEFVTNGDPSYLQRWEEPIYYQINGDPTEQDLAVLLEFAGWLNTLEGFPGIFEAADTTAVNLQIHFCDEQTMVEHMGENFYGADGGTTFWYTDDVIYDAIICYRSDIPQYTRNSVILEEIYNSLGPMQDTDLRKDSIIFSGFSEPQTLTDIDWLILRLLYHPQLRCGMDAAQCEAMIRQLYF